MGCDEELDASGTAAGGCSTGVDAEKGFHMWEWEM